MSAPAIHTRALLVGLTVRAWTARKLDRAVTSKVNHDYAATADAGRYNKMLLPGDCPEYKALTQLVNELRTGHYARTLAWSDEGKRLLPTANYLDYTTWFREVQGRFATALDAFVAAYPALRAQAAVRLNGLFKDADYPSDMDVRGRFEVAVSYDPVPAQGDIRVDLASDQIAAIEADLGHRLSKAADVALADAWARLHETVERMAERLSDPKAVFRDTLVSNVRDVTDVLKRLNVTDNPDLERMRAEVERDLTAFDADDLREDTDRRKATADKATAILATMQGIYGGAR